MAILNIEEIGKQGTNMGKEIYTCKTKGCLRIATKDDAPTRCDPCKTAMREALIERSRAINERAREEYRGTTDKAIDFISSEPTQDAGRTYIKRVHKQEKLPPRNKNTVRGNRCPQCGKHLTTDTCSC